jgi:superfamily II RNA helicase
MMNKIETRIHTVIEQKINKNCKTECLYCYHSSSVSNSYSYTYFTLYGKSLTSRDLKDNQLQIVLPTSSTPAPINDEAARTDSASDDGKKRKHKGQPKQVPQKKAEKIREEHKQQKLEKRIEDEADQIIHVEDLLKEIPIDDYSKSIDLIDQSLSKFKTSTHRLKLLKRKFRLQRKYLESLRNKSVFTIAEKSQLDLLQIGYFATMTEMAHLENIIDVFDQKTKYIEELIDHSPLDHEIWYRFQLEKINSRLPRREQGIPDSRIPDFIPDQWQVDFLDAVDKQQSIIIVAPTASGLFRSFIIFIF